MCTQNSDHDKTVTEFQLKLKSIESNNFFFKEDFTLARISALHQTISKRYQHQV